MDLVCQVGSVPKVGETVLAKKFFTACGGKGANQAIACAKLGGNVSMIGAVGDDENGRQLIKNLQQNNVNCDNVSVCDESSGLAFITVANSNNTIIVAPNANFALKKDSVDRALKRAQSGDILIAQWESPIEIVRHAFELARQKSMTTILNPSPAVKEYSDMLSYVDICILNETETSILTGIQPDSEVQVALAIKKLYESGLKQAILTLGSEGSVVAVGQQITFVDCVKTKVVDTTAAGDTYTGGVAVKLASKCDLLTAAHFASKAASITVSRFGASKSIPYLSEVEV